MLAQSRDPPVVGPDLGGGAARDRSRLRAVSLPVTASAGRAATRGIESRPGAGGDGRPASGHPPLAAPEGLLGDRSLAGLRRGARRPRSLSPPCPGENGRARWASGHHRSRLVQWHGGGGTRRDRPDAGAGPSHRPTRCHLSPVADRGGRRSCGRARRAGSNRGTDPVQPPASPPAPDRAGDVEGARGASAPAGARSPVVGRNRPAGGGRAGAGSGVEPVHGRVRGPGPIDHHRHLAGAAPADGPCPSAGQRGGGHAGEAVRGRAAGGAGGRASQEGGAGPRPGRAGATRRDPVVALLGASPRRSRRHAARCRHRRRALLAAARGGRQGRRRAGGTRSTASA